MREQHQRQFRGSYAPSELHYLVESKTVTAKEGWLLLTIDSFVRSSNTGEGCWASNEYLGARSQMSAFAVSHSIKRLEDLGLLVRQSWDGRRRYLWVKYPPRTPEVTEGGVANHNNPPCASQQPPLATGSKHRGYKKRGNTSSPDKPVTPTEKEREGENGKGNGAIEGNSGGFQRIFLRSWKRRYGRDYPFQKGKDGKALKELFTVLSGNRAAFRAVLKRYFLDNSRFYEGHPASKIHMELSKWTNPVPPGGAPGQSRNSTTGETTPDYKIVTKTTKGKMNQRDFEKFVDGLDLENDE